MPSSWTPSLRFEQQFTGENINLWGDKLNAVLGHADYAVAGWLTKPISGDYAVTTANAGDDEARAAMLKFTGALSADATITLPAVSKSYVVLNATTKALTFGTGAGATVTLDPADLAPVHCDGANAYTTAFAGLPLKDFIAAAGFSQVELPAQAGAAGKFIKSDGANATWQKVSVADLAEYQSLILGVQVALAVAL